jgi:hypothetical protein
MLSEEARAKIIQNAQDWFREELAEAHRKNTSKLSDLGEFKINPFLWHYLANFLTGNTSSESLAKALILPRILGPSITTSFGSRFQNMITRVFEGAVGSQISGMDIEIVDQIDGRTKYCQLKAGPNVINSDDVPVIKANFQKAINLAKTNNLLVPQQDYVLGLFYGEQTEVSAFIEDIAKDYTTYVGQDFWYHLTGDKDFYQTLIDAIAKIASEFDSADLIDQTVKALAKEIESR